MYSFLVVVCLFPISTLVVLYALHTLPITFVWPHTISDLSNLTNQLSSYKSPYHILLVLSITSIWKHAWSIPGSVIWNVLAGALFGSPLATLLLTTLTMLGSACATLLAMPLAPVIQTFFPKPLAMVRSALESSSPRTPTWVRLAILRLIGVVPWSGINIACGVCRVDLLSCMLGTFIGTLPWTAVTCQIGDILQTFSQNSSESMPVSSLLLSPFVILKLLVLSILSLAPILFRHRLMKDVQPDDEEAAVATPEKPPKPLSSHWHLPHWHVPPIWHFLHLHSLFHYNNAVLPMENIESKC